MLVRLYVLLAFVQLRPSTAQVNDGVVGPEQETSELARKLHWANELDRGITSLRGNIIVLFRIV